MARAIGYIPPTHALARKAIATWSDVERRLDETPLPEVQAADKLSTSPSPKPTPGHRLQRPSLYASPLLPVTTLIPHGDDR